MEIIPAILPETFQELCGKLGVVAGAVETVQIDFCDGRFVPNKTWPYADQQPTTNNQQPIFEWRGKGEEGKTGDRDFDELVAEKKGLPHWEELDFEAHLMLRKPQALLPGLVKIGFFRIFLHLESFGTQMRVDEDAGGRGYRDEEFSELLHEWRDAVEVGVALRLETPLTLLDSFAHELRSVLLMGIRRIGVQGEPFDERVISRVRELRRRHPHLIIGVDGGVNSENARALADAGAGRLVVGSTIFSSPDVRAAIAQFNGLV